MSYHLRVIGVEKGSSFTRRQLWLLLLSHGVPMLLLSGLYKLVQGCECCLSLMFCILILTHLNPWHLLLTRFIRYISIYRDYLRWHSRIHWIRCKCWLFWSINVILLSPIAWGRLFTVLLELLLTFVTTGSRISTRNLNTRMVAGMLRNLWLILKRSINLAVPQNLGGLPLWSKHIAAEVDAYCLFLWLSLAGDIGNPFWSIRMDHSLLLRDFCTHYWGQRVAMNMLLYSTGHNGLLI